jgi:hypothetical protein
MNDPGESCDDLKMAKKSGSTPGPMCIALIHQEIWEDQV